MSRTNRMATSNTNPATKFFQWKSEHQKFSYYDKEKKENIFVELPFKFLALSKYITVKGWNQKKKYALISNEVKDIKDDLAVFAYADGNKTEIAKGNWSEIKEKVDNEGGKFTQSVYVMLEDGEIANIQLNGASLSTWFEFQKNKTAMFFDNWVTVNGFKEGKQGAVTYTYPVFEWGGNIGAENEGLATQADKQIEDYEKSYFGQQAETPRERSEVDKYEMNANKPPVPPSEVDAELAMHDSLDHDNDPFPF